MCERCCWGAPAGRPALQQAEQRSVSVLDKKIAEALSYADEVLDVKKDETIEGIVVAKKVVGALGPVQSAVVREKSENSLNGVEQS